MSKIKWGIIGNGSIANAFAHSIKYCDHSNLISVYGRNEATLRQFSKKFNIQAHSDINSLLSSNDIDAVYIATPHNSHFDYVFQAIKNKKHILCEKPITINHIESMVLFGLAKDAEIFLMEAYMYRTHPQTLNILNSLKIIRDTKEDISINCSFGFNAEIPEDHRLRNLMMGGGAILDVGCYPLSMVKLLAGQILGKPYADPESIKVSGELDTTGVDLNSKAHIIFKENIKANISCAINKDFKNNLEVLSGNFKLEVSQPWHCGQFQEGLSSIKIYNKESLIEEITYKDDIGLFTREIDHASQCILKGSQESELISHNDSQSIMLWLDRWRQETGVVCPFESKDVSPMVKSNFYSIQKRKLDSISESNSDKQFSRLVLGCDNQTSDIHAYAMFDYFYGAGGRIFDTAYIYNNGLGDKYLGDWINSRNLQNEVVVLGKGAHTPDCKPELIKPQIEESLERLNISKIDIYCLHRDNHEIPVSEFVDALDEIKTEGLINNIGASNWNLDRFSIARDYALKNNKEPFTVLSNNFSLAEMLEPVWPGCVGIDNQFLDYINSNEIKLFPWSSTARGFFIRKKEITTKEHFSNPSLEEEKRVWHSKKNLKRREICFEIADKKNVEPIEIAIAYIVHTSSLVFPLIGPRTINELNSSIFGSQIDLSEEELRRLSID
ncbi:aldo/keto reductase [Gammaproteobacteria bacterium]|nr:aldo/keto reductase [Gammaproteobacteria bacterium]